MNECYQYSLCKETLFALFTHLERSTNEKDEWVLPMRLSAKRPLCALSLKGLHTHFTTYILYETYILYYIRTLRNTHTLLHTFCTVLDHIHALRTKRRNECCQYVSLQRDLVCALHPPREIHERKGGMSAANASLCKETLFALFTHLERSTNEKDEWVLSIRLSAKRPCLRSLPT